MPSFDVVSQVEMHEVSNAVDQVRREIKTRFDLKGSKTQVDLNDAGIEILADDEMKLRAVQQLLREKLARRKVSLKSVVFKDPARIGGDMLKQEVTVKQGLNADELRQMHKLIKGRKLKVTAQMQGDQLRVSGKKKDDLQKVISCLRDEVQEIELQFINYRDCRLFGLCFSHRQISCRSTKKHP